MKTEVIDMKARVRKLRKKLKLTQEAFGNSIGMSKSNVCNIESGLVSLREGNIDLICEKYHVNQNWLLNGEGEMFVELSEDDELGILIGEFLAEDDPYKKKIIKTMLSLKDEDWMLIQRLMQKFKD